MISLFSKNILKNIGFVCFWVLLIVSLYENTLGLQNSSFLHYRENISSFLDNSKETNNTFFYTLQLKRIKMGIYECYYDVAFKLKNVVPDSGLNEDLLNFARIFTNSFRANFIIDKNLNSVYSPNIEYTYQSDSLFLKYKDRINEANLKEFANSVFYSLWDWFGRLKSPSKIDFVKYSIELDYNIFYDEPKIVDLNLSKNKYKAKFFKGVGNINKIVDKDNTFSLFDLKDTRINSFEYYDENTGLPLLLQREIMVTLFIKDPNLRIKYIQDFGKPTIDYRISRTLMLIYSN